MQHNAWCAAYAGLFWSAVGFASVNEVAAWRIGILVFIASTYTIFIVLNKLSK